MIMFLLRSIFWLGLVVMLLPVDKTNGEAVAGQSASAPHAIEIASGTLSDIAGFCLRKPDVCEKGREFAAAFGEKAVYASGLLYKYLDTQLTDKPTEDATDQSTSQAS